MKRRDFVRKSSLVLGAGAVVAACGSGETDGRGPSVQTKPRIRWRLVSSFPRSLDTIFGTSTILAERVSELTDGRFEIRAYPAGELVPALEVLGAVQNGTVQMGHSAGYYFVGKNPALAFDTTIPFGLTARQHTAWLHYGGGMELLRELYADFNVINFAGGNTGAQMGGWFRREIGSLADVRGLKMRIPGMGGRVMNELGTTVQVIGGGEIYPALERGVIDATEWVGPYDDEKLGFHEVAQFYYYPGWWEPGPALSFLVNRQAWDQLPGQYQQALEVATHEASVRMLASYDAKNPPALKRLVDAGVQLRAFPSDVMRAASATTREILAADATDPLYRRLQESYEKWRTESFEWFRIAEHSYASFAYDGAPAAAEECAPGEIQL